MAEPHIFRKGWPLVPPYLIAYKPGINANHSSLLKTPSFVPMQLGEPRRPQKNLEELCLGWSSVHFPYTLHDDRHDPLLVFFS